jgi:hypothetical protein
MRIRLRRPREFSTSSGEAWRDPSKKSFDKAFSLPSLEGKTLQ